MAETKRTILLEYDVVTKKLVDENGKAIKSIKQLSEAYKQQAEAAQKMGDVEGENSKIVFGSISHIRNQISVLKKQRESTVIGSKEFENLTLKIENLNKNLKQATSATVAQAEAQEQVGQSTKELAKLQENQARSAGLAGAAAFELGRTISDLPFGLVAISNNISQLGTLFAALVANAGGVSKALGFLKQQLIGPSGILIGFQVVVAAVTAITRAMDKAEKSVNKLAEAEAAAATNLKFLREAINSTSLSYEDANALIEDANAKYDGLNLRLGDNFQLTNDSKTALDDLILSMERAAKAKAALTLVEELYKEQIEEQIFLEKLRTDSFGGLKGLIEGIKTGLAGGIVAPGLGKALRIDAAEARLENVQDRINEIITTVGKEGLADMIFDGIGPKKADEDDGGRMNFIFATKEELEAIKDSIKGTTRFINLQIARLEEQRDTYARTTEEIKKYNDQIDILQGQLRILQEGRPLKVSELLAPEPKGVFKADILEQIAASVPTDEEVSEYLKAKVSGDTTKAIIDAMLAKIDSAEQMANRFQMLSRISDAFNDVLQAQADREIAIEQNKTTALNDQLRTRLANEQLSAEERDKINQQISRNDAELVKKQNEIAKKQFERDKALKIVTAIGDTASASLRAYASQINPLDPTSIGRAQVAAAITAAFGLAQIAAISRTKYTEKALPSPNLVATGGGQGQQSSPSFNVVGTSQRNQLAEAVELAMSKQPVKAYVVSSDVTTAQQLERNIVEGASI